MKKKYHYFIDFSLTDDRFADNRGRSRIAETAKAPHQVFEDMQDRLNRSPFIEFVDLKFQQFVHPGTPEHSDLLVVMITREEIEQDEEGES